MAGLSVASCGFVQMKTVHAFLGLALIKISLFVTQAAIEPVTIMLSASIEQARCVVPTGKVLILPREGPPVITRQFIPLEKP